ncbi:MAG TPA: capsule assembly Wzi family protein [Gammaproteobacteria bacterium]|nr:capsule assembly Wzi family protein [Gammaproteobacteria bacterium]
MRRSGGENRTSDIATAGAWLVLSFLLASAASAASLIRPGDPQLRSDIELLADAGYIRAPVTSWPLPWTMIAADLQNANIAAMSPAEWGAWSRVVAALGIEQRHSPRARVGASVRAGDPPPLRWYDAEPRADQTLTLGLKSGTAGDFSYNAQLTLVHNADDHRETIRPDGSYASYHAGNWLINAGWINRWWGPGWSGSMSLSTNARPIPGIALSRASAEPFELPVLNWLGPWRFTLFVDRLEDDRYIPHPWFFGARFAFKPVHNVTIGLSRTSQWGGEGMPQDWVHFRDMVFGHSYHSNSAYQGTGVPGSSQAGFDIRWHFDIGDQPFALYAYEGGVDASETTRIFPRKFTGMLGFETTGAMNNGGSWRLFAEYADTTTGFLDLDNSSDIYNVAYENGGYRSGYRYLGRSIAYTTDNDSRTVNIGAILSYAPHRSLTLLLRTGTINRDNRSDSPPGGNTVSRRAADLLAVAASWAADLPRAMGQIVIAAGVTRWEPANAAKYYDQRVSLSWCYEF